MVFKRGAQCAPLATGAPKSQAWIGLRWLNCMEGTCLSHSLHFAYFIICITVFCEKISMMKYSSQNTVLTLSELLHALHLWVGREKWSSSELSGQPSNHPFVSSRETSSWQVQMYTPHAQSTGTENDLLLFQAVYIHKLTCLQEQILKMLMKKKWGKLMSNIWKLAHWHWHESRNKTFIYIYIYKQRKLG